jgi:hypothetical protein
MATCLLTDALNAPNARNRETPCRAATVFSQRVVDVRFAWRD